MASAVETILKYRVDRASLNQASASTGAARRVVDEYIGTLKSIDPAARESLRAVADFWDASSIGAERAVQNARDLTRELQLQQRLETSAGRDSQSARRGRGGAETIDRLGTIGSQIFGGLGSGELANVAGLMGDLGGSIASLGVAGGITVGVMAAVSIATAEYNRRLEESRAALRTALEVNEQYYDAIANFTTEQARARLNELDAQRGLLLQQAQQLRGLVESAFNQSVAQLGDAGARALFASGAFSDLEEAARAAEGELAANTQLIGRLADALNANAFAARDAAEAAEQAQQRFLTSILQGAEAIEQDALQRARIEELSSEAARQRIAAIEDERAALQESIAFLEQWVAAQPEAAAALEERRQQLIDLNVEEAQLNEALSTTIAQREAETAAIKRQTENIARIKAEREREQEATKARLVEISTAERKIADLRTQGAAEIAKIQSDLRQREIAIAQSYAERQQDIIESARRDEREALIQFERERRRIIRDGTRAELTAIGNRDALALLNARRSKDEQLDDLQDNANDERRKRLESLTLQQQDAQRAYRQQINDARRAAAEQVNASRARINTEIAAQQQIIRTAQSALLARVNVERSAYSALGGAVAGFVAKMQQAAAALNATNIKGSRPGSTTTVTTSSGGNTQFKALAQALGRA